MYDILHVLIILLKIIPQKLNVFDYTVNVNTADVWKLKCVYLM